MAINYTPNQTQATTDTPITAGTSPYASSMPTTTPAMLPTYQAPTFTSGQESFTFDPNKYLPGIKQQAESIYSPQKAQLEALRQLSASQAESARVTTKEDFAKQMQNEIENINQRGAFFSGGALKQQAETADRQTRALQDINTQWLAQNFSNIAQQAGLNAQQAEYIQNQLSGAQGSAYNMFQSERQNFQTERNFQTQLKQYKDEKKFREKQLKAQGKSAKEAKKQAEKEFKENKRRWELQYADSKKKSGGSNDSKVFNTVQDYASNWVSNLSNPYERPGGREGISQQLANQYGGNSQDYINKYFQPGWESTYWKQPTTKKSSSLEDLINSME